VSCSVVGAPWVTRSGLRSEATATAHAVDEPRDSSDDEEADGNRRVPRPANHEAEHKHRGYPHA
jgi:hypothetical protein